MASLFLSGMTAAVPAAVTVLMFWWLRSDMKRIEQKVDKVHDDHNALGREVAELKGYLRPAPDSPSPAA